MSEYSSLLFNRKFEMTDSHKKLTIWKSYHKESQIHLYGLFENERIFLFNTRNLGYDGKSINNLNRFLCEGVCILYPYFNNLKSDYIGFQHYRRWFNSSLNNLRVKEMNEGKIQVFKNDVVNEALNIETYQHVIYSTYNFWMEKDCGFYDDVIEYLQKNFPEYLTTPTDKNVFHGYSIFACKWEKYVKFCELFWGYITFVADKYGFNVYNEDDWIAFIKEHYILYNRNHNTPGRVTRWGPPYGRNNWCNDDYINDTESFHYYRLFSYNLEFFVSLFSNVEGYVYDPNNKIHLEECKFLMCN